MLIIEATDNFNTCILTGTSTTRSPAGNIDFSTSEGTQCCCSQIITVVQPCHKIFCTCYFKNWMEGVI